jgi:hypothetical protein
VGGKGSGQGNGTILDRIYLDEEGWTEFEEAEFYFQVHPRVSTTVSLGKIRSRHLL